MKNGGQNTLLVVRGEIMQSSKINSRNTYNKCMNQLDEFGYIRYYPSLDPYQPSRVVMKKLSATKNDNNGNR